MCGFFGINHQISLDDDLAEKSLEKIHSRGPDETNIYKHNKVFLGHKRLSIIDNKTGKQPMLSEDENVVVIYNGEIYNFLELKKKYSFKFRTNSDTEILIAGYKIKGIKFIEDLRGMYSFAIYDKKINKIFLVRDNIGIKPLVYYFSKDIFIFSSEIKSILNYVKNIKVNINAVNEFFTRRFIPATKTIYNNTYKLKKGTFLEYNITNKNYKIIQFQNKYFSNNESIENKIKSIKNKFKETVKSHLLSDVPISLMLSGGVDSSILAKVCKDLDEDITSFTLATSKDKTDPDQDYIYAKAVCDKLNIKNNFIYVENINKYEIIDIISYLDEPYCDPAFISSAILLKEIGKNYKVSLSGDGADELFYGYYSYQKIASKKFFFKNKIDLSYLYLLSVKIKSFINYFENDYINNYTHNYYGLPISLLKKIFKRNIVLDPPVPDSFQQTRSRDYDIDVNLPDYYLNRLDKAGMMNSVEVRVPFCDIELFKFVNEINYNGHTENINGKVRGKKVLRSIYENELPKGIFTRKKQGFKRNLNDIVGKKVIEELYDNYVNKEVSELLNISKFYQKIIKNYPNSIAFQLKWRLLVFGIWFDNNKHSIEWQN